MAWWHGSDEEVYVTAGFTLESGGAAEFADSPRGAEEVEPNGDGWTGIPVNDQTRFDPGWWMTFLANKFVARDRTYDYANDPFQPYSHEPLFRTRRLRMDWLWRYFIGRPPLPQLREEYQEAFHHVLRKANACYAPMCVDALLDRMTLTGVRTSAADGPEGDALAKQIMQVSGFAAAIKDALTYMFTMSEAYMMVVPAMPGAPDQTPLITAEDPRLCVGEQDPMNPNVLRAALKLGFDTVRQRVVAWIYPGDGYRYQASQAGTGWIGVTVSAAGFVWDCPPVAMPQLGEYGGVPVVRLVNAHGMGEYEKHLDLLDRINETIMDRLAITKYQSFRQRGLIGDIEGDEDDEDSPVEQIDWNNIFSASPGSLWRLPAGSSFWESSQADLTPIMSAIKADVMEFAACTRTPLHLVTPDVATQSAEGASLMREGIVFKVRDRRDRVNPALVQLWRMAFALAGQPRADVQMLWGPIETYSLAEKGALIQQTRGVLSRARQLVDILEMTPPEAQDNAQELMQDQILDSQLTVAPPPSMVRLTENVTEHSQTTGQPNPSAAPAVP